MKVLVLLMSIIATAIIILSIVGEIKCIVKACRCNWEPIGKAEVVYTAGVLTGAGAIIGWLDIEDK